MTTKYPRDIDEPVCEWCDGSGEFGQLPCDRCNGTGWARFDPSNLNARTRSETWKCPACGYRWTVATETVTAWCPKCNATPPLIETVTR